MLVQTGLLGEPPPQAFRALLHVKLFLSAAKTSASRYWPRQDIRLALHGNPRCEML